MAIHTTQKVIELTRLGGSEKVLNVFGGTVTVEVKIGNDWISEGTYTDGSYVFASNRVTVRITPAGGAKFEVQ